MRYQRCPSNPRLRCYEHNHCCCPLSMRGWMETVDRWALTNRTPRSLDCGAIMGGLNIGGSEAAAVRSANICQLFRDPESVLGWILAGQNGRAPITMAICQDLKQAWRTWKHAQGAHGMVGRTYDQDRYSSDSIQPLWGKPVSG